MITDFDDFCTWMYILVSDTYAPLAHCFPRPGPQPACSDAELLTIALVSECCGWDRETDLLARWQEHRDLFPILPERTRFNRRRRALLDAWALLRRAILATLDLATDSECIIDSLPVPVVQFYHAPQASSEWAIHQAAFGKCCTKKQTIFGYKLHLLVTLGGVIRDFELAPANVTDLVIGGELLAEHQHLIVLADKAYISASIAAALHAERDIQLLTVPRSNQRVQLSAALRQQHAQIRQLIETVVGATVWGGNQSCSYLLGAGSAPVDQANSAHPLHLAQSPAWSHQCAPNQAVGFSQLAQLPITIAIGHFSLVKYVLSFENLCSFRMNSHDEE